MLWGEIYDEVHRLARSMLARERPTKPIETTVLVHELYLKMGDASFDNRSHLFGSLVRMMGQIVVDAARRRQARRRGEGAGAALHASIAGSDGSPLLSTNDVGIEDPQGAAGASAVEALMRLDELAPRAAAVAWLRFVGGLSVEQVGRCLDISERTVKGDWSFARAWIHRELIAQGLRPKSRTAIPREPGTEAPGGGPHDT